MCSPFAACWNQFHRNVDDNEIYLCVQFAMYRYICMDFDIWDRQYMHQYFPNGVINIHSQPGYKHKFFLIDFMNRSFFIL